MTVKKYIADEQAMLKLGKQLANICKKGSLIFLQGNLGAGKTTLTRGFLQGLGYQDIVKSPTYTLIESYEFEDLNVYHFDLYRLNDLAEFEYLGFEDYLQENSICLVEWPENAMKLLPEPDLLCKINIEAPGRTLYFSGKTKLLEKIK